MAHTPKGKPDWFNLNNYAGLEELGHYQWALLLSRRSVLLSHIQKRPEWLETIKAAHRPESVAGLRSSIEILDEALRRSRTAPLDARAIKFFSWPANEEVSVTPLGALDIHHMKCWIKQADEEDYWHTDCGDDQYGLSLNFARTAFVVDIEAPDELLMQDFKEAVECARKRKKVNTPARQTPQKIIKALTNCNILAYLDLKIWALEKDIQLTANDYYLWIKPRTSIRNMEKAWRFWEAEALLGSTFRHLYRNEFPT